MVLEQTETCACAGAQAASSCCGGSAAVTNELNTLQYDASLCIGCGMCAIVCPHGVFALVDGVRAAQLVRWEACMECGACQLNCPTGAIIVDSGVGCAAAMIRAALTGKEPTCGPSDGEESCCCS
jgi:NAD-dependent dihydropyrimidine dehydrogenase PreA subunit